MQAIAAPSMRLVIVAQGLMRFLVTLGILGEDAVDVPGRIEHSSPSVRRW